MDRSKLPTQSSYPDCLSVSKINNFTTVSLAKEEHLMCKLSTEMVPLCLISNTLKDHWNRRLVCADESQFRYHVNHNSFVTKELSITRI